MPGIFRKNMFLSSSLEEEITDNYTDFTSAIFVSNSGNSSNDGLNENKSIDTITNGLAELSTAGWLVIPDASGFDEDITTSDYENIYAPMATISQTSNKNLELEAGRYFFDTVEGANDNSLILNQASSGYCHFEANRVRLLAGGSGVAIRNAVGNLLNVKIKDLSLIGDGDGVADFTGVGSHIHVTIDDIYLHSTGDGISIENGGEVVGTVEHCSYVAGGSGNFLNVSNGTADLNCHLIESDINIGASGTASLTIQKMTGDITVAAGGTLYIDCPEFTGSLTNNGTIFGQLGDTFYGGQTFNSTVDVKGALSAFNSITVDAGAGDDSEIIIEQDGSEKGKLYYFDASDRIQLTNSSSAASLVIKDDGDIELTSNTGGNITLDSVANIFLEGGAGGKVESNVSMDIATGKEYQIDGTSINTAGTLSNVAYLDQANSFTDDGNSFNGGIRVGSNGAVAAGYAIDARDDMRIIGSDGQQTFEFNEDASSNRVEIQVGGSGHTTDTIRLGRSEQSNVVEVPGFRFDLVGTDSVITPINTSTAYTSNQLYFSTNRWLLEGTMFIGDDLVVNDDLSVSDDASVSGLMKERGVSTTSASSLFDYDISGGNTIILTGTSTPITIRGFDGGQDGVCIRLVKENSSSTLSFTHNDGSAREPIYTPDGANFSISQDYGVWEFTYYDGVWYMHNN